MGLESVSVFNVCLWPPQISFFHYNVVYIPNIVLPGLFDEEASTRPVEWLFVYSTNWTMVGADFSSDYWAVWVDLLFTSLADVHLICQLGGPLIHQGSNIVVCLLGGEHLIHLEHCCLGGCTPNPPTCCLPAWWTPNPPTHRWELHPLKKPLSTP